MTKTVYVLYADDGHGENTSGKRTPHIPELGRAIKENEFNSAVVSILKRDAEKLGIIVHLVAPTGADTSLSTRVKSANTHFKELQHKYGKGNVKAAYVSVHYDAVDGKFDGEGKDPEGLTVFIYPGTLHKESGKLAKAVNKYLAQGTTQKNRGIKESNFQVLRDTAMPAILTENGFMDNKREALLMINQDFREEVAREHLQGVCEYFGISYVKASVSSPTLLTEGNFRVKIIVDELNYRAGAGVNHPIKGVVKCNQVFTITHTMHGWGKLKSGAGWINLDSKYVQRL